MAANRKMIHTYILIFYLTSFLSFNLSGQTTSIWKEGSDYLDITKGVQYIADANKSLQVDDIEKLILKKGLTPIEKPIFNYPLSADVFWFYFELENSRRFDFDNQSIRDC